MNIAASKSLFAARPIPAAPCQDPTAAAFVSPGGSTASAVMSRTEQPVRFALRLDGVSPTAFERPERAIATAVSGS